MLKSSTRTLLATFMAPSISVKWQVGWDKQGERCHLRKAVWDPSSATHCMLFFISLKLLCLLNDSVSLVSPFPAIVLSLPCVIASLPGKECHQTSNFLLKPGNHFTRGSRLCNDDISKAPVQVFLWSSLPSFLLHSTSGTDRWRDRVTRRQWGCLPLERHLACLEAWRTVIHYIIIQCYSTESWSWLSLCFQKESHIWWPPTPSY